MADMDQDDEKKTKESAIGPKKEPEKVNVLEPAVEQEL